MKNQRLLLQDKKKGLLTYKNIGLGLVSFLWGYQVMQAMSLSCVLIFFSYTFYRDIHKGILALFFYLMGCACISFWTFYFNAIILCVFILLIEVHRLFKGHLYSFFPILCGLIALIGNYFTTRNWIEAGMIAYCTYALTLVILKPNEGINQEMQPILVSLFLLSLAACFFKLNEQYSLCIFLFLFTLLAQICNIQAFFLLLFSFSSFLFSSDYLSNWMIGFLLIACMKDCGKGAQLLGFVFPLFLATSKIEVLLFACFLFLSTSFLSSNFDFLSKKQEDYSKRQYALQKRLLEHQLNQFVLIFKSISAYFKDDHSLETSFIEGMAESMQLLSMQLKRVSGSLQEESIRIYEILKGYNYSIIKVNVSENEQGQKRVELFFKECKRQEVHEIILPLLKMNVDPSLKLISFSPERSFRPMARLELASASEMKIKTCKLQIRKLKEASGDTCSIYKWRQYTICTLSDGMGVGKNAQEASKFVTQLTQQLFSCGIPPEMAVQSMNSLLRLKNAESFATLDLLVFDGSLQEVYMSKSGACATLLIRKNEILPIHGQALPLGIIEEIEADCFKMKCYKGDCFILFSDGIEEEELKTWLLNCKKEDYKTVLQTKMEKMNAEDDVTIFLAEVA